jgi:hypothetical protein
MMMKMMRAASTFKRAECDCCGLCTDAIIRCDCFRVGFTLECCSRAWVFVWVLERRGASVLHA